MCLSQPENKPELAHLINKWMLVSDLITVRCLISNYYSPLCTTKPHPFSIILRKIRVWNWIETLVTILCVNFYINVIKSFNFLLHSSTSAHGSNHLFCIISCDLQFKCRTFVIVRVS